MDAASKRRRFVTTRGIEAARETGVLVIGMRDVITDEAAQRARDLGIVVRREGKPAVAVPEPTPDPGPIPVPQPDPSSAPTRRPTSDSTDPISFTEPRSTPAPAPSLREVVLAALRAELGSRADNIEAVLDAVLAREGY